MSESAKHTPGPHQARFIYRMIRAARESKELIFAFGPEHDWADAELWAAAPETAAERDRLKAEVERLTRVAAAYRADAHAFRVAWDVRQGANPNAVDRAVSERLDLIRDEAMKGGEG